MERFPTPPVEDLSYFPLWWRTSLVLLSFLLSFLLSLSSTTEKLFRALPCLLSLSLSFFTLLSVLSLSLSMLDPFVLSCSSCDGNEMSVARQNSKCRISACPHFLYFCTLSFFSSPLFSYLFLSRTWQISLPLRVKFILHAHDLLLSFLSHSTTPCHRLPLATKIFLSREANLSLLPSFLLNSFFLSPSPSLARLSFSRDK